MFLLPGYLINNLHNPDRHRKFTGHVFICCFWVYGTRSNRSDCHESRQEISIRGIQGKTEGPITGESHYFAFTDHMAFRKGKKKGATCHWVKILGFPLTEFTVV